MTITSSVRTGSSVTETRRITVPDRKAAPRPKPRVTVGGVVRVVGLGLWLLITLFPLYWITLTAFKSPGTINRFPIEYWPSEPSLDNFTSLFEKSSFGTFWRTRPSWRCRPARWRRSSPCSVRTCWRGSSSAARGRCSSRSC
ncbi:hypothetical protein AB1285_24585 [Microbacterium sp. NRRL B-14842]|uniref:hypothetical protein n=1 Tax=Microbacterium sp. NRRL B-14842 TaxID=3162881 RepID=UPI003D2922D6